MFETLNGHRSLLFLLMSARSCRYTECMIGHERSPVAAESACKRDWFSTLAPIPRFTAQQTSMLEIIES